MLKGHQVFKEYFTIKGSFTCFFTFGTLLRTGQLLLKFSTNIALSFSNNDRNGRT